MEADKPLIGCVLFHFDLSDLSVWWVYKVLFPTKRFILRVALELWTFNSVRELEVDSLYSPVHQVVEAKRNRF